MSGVDWKLDADGDLVVPIQYTKGIEAVAQGLRVRLLNFQGEWFLDLDSGTPWFQDILGQVYDQNKIRSIFRQRILEAPGVASIDSLELEYNGSTRALSVTWRVITDLEGEEITDAITFDV